MSQQVQGRFSGRSFVDETIKLDSSVFSGCTFLRCTMIYSGGEIPELSGCGFDDCAWQFGGEAANTIGFLSGMYQGGFDRLIESTFHEIRRGALISQSPGVPGDTPAGADRPSSDGAKAGGSASPARFLKPLRVFRIPKQEPSS